MPQLSTVVTSGHRAQEKAYRDKLQCGSHSMKTMPEGSYQKVQHLITGFFFAVFFTISQTKQSNNIVKYSIYPQTLEIKNILI